MVYVYDTLVNLNEELIDFYDWEESDDYVHIRRVPLYKVNSIDYMNFVTKKVRLDEEELSKLYDKAQIFSNRGIDSLKYAFVVTDGNGAVILEFNDKGFISRRSKFIVNEEMEIIDMAKSVREEKIKYNVVSKKINRSTMIRSEKKILNDILEELNSIKNDKEKIDYLYYEWFDSNDGDDKYFKLVSDLKSKFTDKHIEFLELLNLLTIKNNV